ncbi:MAG TPA: type IV pilus biogenesis/stability protein PilW [Burkholderiales bacterium]|nr:type IV pilus biogenesis/stability protein PilW [Burkholderiales bacterium]
MRKILYLLLVVTAGFLAGCQSNPPSETRGIDMTQTEPDEGQITERADGRTRAEVHTELASAYYGAGRLGVAMEETRIALAADPTYAPAYNMQGLVSLDMRDHAAAEQAFKKGLQLAPTDADLNHNYGWFLCRVGRETESTQWFLAAIKNPLYATPARTYSAAATCLHSKSPREAQEFYETALRMDPNNPLTLQSYAQLQYERGNYAAAYELLARYNRVTKEPNAEALWLALRVARKQGDRGSEASFASQLRRRFPQSPEANALQRGAFD